MKINIIISFLFLNVLFCEEDSTHVYKFNDVVITGTRNPVSVEKLSSSVQTADSMLIEQSNGSSIADVISTLSGVSLRSYGGNAALQSISIRGMSSDYSLILVNGQRFTTFQTNTVDLGIFSLSDVDHIEVAIGGNSSLYGTDAVGGVVNIITKKPSGRTFGLLSGSVGSFGLNAFQFSLGSGNGQLSARTTIRNERSPNNYTFYYSDGSGRKNIQRSGADYLIRNYGLSIGKMFDTIAVTTINLSYSNAERGQPAAVTSSYQNNLARINDKDLLFSVQTEIELSNDWNVSVPVSFYNKYQTYHDLNQLSNGIPLSSYYENNSFSITPAFRYSASEADIINGGFDIVEAYISSNEVLTSRREQLSAFISSQHTFNLPLETIIYPSIRYDSFSDVEGALSPKIGINIGITNQPLFRLRSSYSKNYRVPTFNDLYWISGGNPLLKPEHSTSFDVGCIAGTENDWCITSVELNYFVINATDKIVWQPISSTVWSPKNLQSVSSKGLEISTKVNIYQNLLTFNFHHNFVQAVKTSGDYPGDVTQNKLLAFVPQETSTLIVGSSYTGMSINVIYSLTGYRYQTADNNPRFILPTFDQVDMNVSYGFIINSISMRIKFEANNLLDSDFQLISGYPTPLRNYRLNSEISF